MTYEEARDELKRYHLVYKEYQDEYELLKRLQESSIKAYLYDQVRVQSSNKQDTSTTISKIEEMEKKHFVKINSSLEYIDMVERKIESIHNELYRIILRNRYIKSKTLEEIGETESYSVKYLQVLLGKATKEYAKI